MCPKCSKEKESEEHLLLRCSDSKEFWKNCLPTLHLQSGFDRSIARLVHSLAQPSIGKEDYKLRLQRFLEGCWILWRCRNEYVFRGDKTTTSQALRRLEILRMHVPDLDPSPKVNLITTKPDFNFEEFRKENQAVICCDGALPEGSDTGGAAAVAICKDKNILGGLTLSFKADDALQCEFMGAQLAVKLVIRLKLSKVTMMSDNVQLINIMNHDEEPPWKLAAVYNDIAGECNDMSVIWLYIPRMYNVIADFAARGAAKGQGWDSIPRSDLSSCMNTFRSF